MRTVHEIITAPKRLQEAEDRILTVLEEEKLTPLECVGMFEKIKYRIMGVYV